MAELKCKNRKGRAPLSCPRTWHHVILFCKSLRVSKAFWKQRSTERDRTSTAWRLTRQRLKCDPLPQLCSVIPYGCDADDVLGVRIKSRQVYFSDVSWNPVRGSGFLPAFGWGDLDCVVGPAGAVAGHDRNCGLSFLDVVDLQLNWLYREE